MPVQKARERIKKRFIRAIEIVSKERYPQQLQAEVLRSVGFAPSNYYKMRTNPGNYPTLDHCFEICSKYKVSAEWLLLGKGDMIRVELKSNSATDMLKAAIRIIESKKTVK